MCVCVLTILHSELLSLQACGEEQGELLLSSLPAHTDLLPASLLQHNHTITSMLWRPTHSTYGKMHLLVKGQK